MAPATAQKSTKAASAGRTSGVKSFCAKTRPAKTKRFLTHCRGRSEAKTAVSRRTSRQCPPHRPAHGFDLGVGELREARQGEDLARGLPGDGPIGLPAADALEERLPGDGHRIVDGR